MSQKYFNTIDTAIYYKAYSDCGEIIERYTSTRDDDEHYTLSGTDSEYYQQIDDLDEIKEVTLTNRETKILYDIIDKNKLLNCPAFHNTRKGGYGIQFNFIYYADGRKKGQAPLLLRRVDSYWESTVQPPDHNCFSAGWDYVADEVYSRAFEVVKSRDDWFYVKIQRESISYDDSQVSSYACDGFLGLVKLIEQEVDNYLKEKNDK